MNFHYEENLQENPFFVKIIEHHVALVNEVGNGDWIILVPKRTQITDDCLKSNEFLLSHVLLPSDDLPKTHFSNLLGLDIIKSEKALKIKDDKNFQSLILFEEMFYTKDLQKFKILCIETPLCKRFIQKTMPSHLVKNLTESKDLLTRHMSSKGGGMRKIENALSNFTLRIQKVSDYEKLRINLKLLYDYCLNLLCPKKMKIMDPFHLTNIKVSLEYFLMDEMYPKVFDSICTHCGEENRNFNKILRKLSDITIEDLNITGMVLTSIKENLNVVRIELMKISGCRNSFDKLYCIKNAIDLICAEQLLTTDELLPALVYVIIKTNFYHWIPTLAFIKESNLSQMLGPENQSAGSAMFYILTTLEAVIFFIQTNENLPIQKYQLLKFKKVDEIKSADDYIQYLFHYVKENNEIQLMQLINVSYSSFILQNSSTDLAERVSLCHPLCSCSSCRIEIADKPDSNINTRSCNSLTMLHIASFFNCPKIVSILMNMGADADVKDDDGLTPLHYAAQHGHQKVVFLLLHGKSSINSLTNSNQTALLLASQNGHESCVKALLYFAEHSMLNIDLNCQDIDGNSALHYASQAGFEAILDGLLEYHAKATSKNNIGKTPIDVAYNSIIQNKLETAAKYQFEGNERDFVFITNEELADNIDDHI